MRSVVVSGRVSSRETKQGVGELVVAAVAENQRLGSAVTSPDGGFAIEIALPVDAPLTVAIAVSAPEQGEAAKPLLITAPRRVSANEVFLIWLPEPALRDAGVAGPRGREEPDDPALVLARAASDVSRRVELSRSAAALQSPHVAARRERADAAQVAVEAGLRAELGMTRARRRVAAPGIELAGPLGAAVRDGVAGVRAGGPSVLRLTITTDQLDALRVAPGSADLVGERVEALAFAGGARARTRDDAIARWNAQLRRGLPGLDDPEDLSLPPASPSPVAPAADLDAALATAIDEIARGTAPVIAPRADEASLRGRLRGLEVAGGPADRTAFFDYGVLIGTIDGVWQELLDRDLVATAAELQQAVADAGGAVDRGAAPLTDHLHAEARAVAAGAPAGARFRSRVFDQAQTIIGTGVTAAELLDVLFGRSRDRDHRGEGTSARPPVVSPGETPADPTTPPTPAYAALLAELDQRLDEPHAFQVFAADGDTRAVDFGLFVTYRQRWVPEGHQAGALVKTVTLAPREERAYVTRSTWKRAATAVRATAIETQRRSESQDSTRSAADIVNAAKASLGFESSTSGGVAVGELFSGEASASVTRASERSSQETRQLVREAVRRVAQEAKESNRVEVTTTESLETVHEESGRLVNPNDELPVTYLFYELQRRFRVSERVHQMVPVVMVARSVPAPERITRGWLFAHGWILERALLDEQFREPLHYLLRDAAGAEAKLGVLETHVANQRALVATLREEVDLLARQTATRYGAVTAAFATLLAAQGEDAADGFVEQAFETVLGGGGSVETARLREQMAKEAHDQAARAERDARERLGQAVSSLEAATRDYSEALAGFRDRELAVRRLRIHVKQHILHYLRAIWNAEDRDQRAFELHSVRVPRLAGHLDYRAVADPAAPPVPPLWEPPVTIEATLVPDGGDPLADTVALGDLADLEHPLGYKGNFMVFPLRRHNVLTRFLALPYLDDRAGARDPELLANFTLTELDEHVACLRRALPRDELAARLPHIHALYQALLARPFPDEEEIVVPTGSTFIEALPGTRPVLEDFRLLHRALDVARAAAEVRHRELENLRRVARLRAGELGDPDVETTVVAAERAGLVVAPTGPGPGGG